ncbi:MAG: EsaB/YukD family protein [Lachnospira sp.]
MEKDTIIIRFLNKDKEVDLEIPSSITAQEFIVAVNEVYDLGIDTMDIKNCYLQAENPIALLKGNKTLSEYGFRNGTIVYFVK